MKYSSVQSDLGVLIVIAAMWSPSEEDMDVDWMVLRLVPILVQDLLSLRVVSCSVATHSCEHENVYAMLLNATQRTAPQKINRKDFYSCGAMSGMSCVGPIKFE